MSRYLKGTVDESLGLVTLAAGTLVSATFDEAVTEETLVTSIVASWALEGWTDAAGDGPVEVGYAHSDYSDAEIEAVIENAGSWDFGDKIDQEISKRLVRKIGQFRSVTGGISVLNDGKPIKTKLNWRLITGQRLRLWAYNHGSSALTTGAFVHLNGHANLFVR